MSSSRQPVRAAAANADLGTHDLLADTSRFAQSSLAAPSAMGAQAEGLSDFMVDMEHDFAVDRERRRRGQDPGPGQGHPSPGADPDRVGDDLRQALAQARVEPERAAGGSARSIDLAAQAARHGRAVTRDAQAGRGAEGPPAGSSVPPARPAQTAPATPAKSKRALGCPAPGCPGIGGCERESDDCPSLGARLAIQGFVVVKLVTTPNSIFVIARLSDRSAKCSRCDSLALTDEERIEARFADRPIGRRRVQWLCDVPNWRCVQCGKLFAARLPGCATLDMTERLIEWVAEQSTSRTLADIARQAGIDSVGHLGAIVDARRVGAASAPSTMPGESGGWELPVYATMPLGAGSRGPRPSDVESLHG